MFKLSGNALPRMSLLLATFSLAACGGGGGSSGGGNNLTPDDGDDSVTVETVVNPGLFGTMITYPSGQESETAATLISPTGKYVSIISDADGTFGELTFASDGTFADDSAKNVYFDQGWQSEDGLLEGSVVSREELTASYTAPHINSNIALGRDNQASDLGVTLQALDATFTMSGGVTTTVNIDADGAVTGSDTTGCNFNGTVTIPDDTYNVFEVGLSLSGCGDIAGGASGSQRNGEYEGLGTYDPGNTELLFAGTNGSVVALFIGVK